jgi:alcohol dehydrogenase class IV
VGGVSHLPHDLAVALVLPYGTEFNGFTAEAKQFRTMYLDFAKKLGLPENLREAGVKEDQFLRIINGALRDGAALTNRKQPVSKEDMAGILTAAFEGRDF